MKLVYYITFRVSIALTLILTVWAIFFYVAMIDEVNDEVDDSLENYAETILIRSLAGEELPSQNSGSNNQYYLMEISPEYAESTPKIRYRDSMIYIPEIREKEPARILNNIFQDNKGRFYELTVSTPTFERDDLKKAVLMWVVFLYVTLLFVILLITVWVFYRNMRPLYTLLHWLDVYQAGKKNKPLENDTHITEFRKLNEAAIRNMERSELLFEQQKQFIGNASHEIQTPLAICRNRLEMLMEDETLSEYQLEELMKTHRTLEHITKMNKSLLLLSKIDNCQFMDAKEIEVNTLLKTYLNDYQEVYEYKNIKVAFIENDILKVKMNESLAITLFTNLLKNAFVHNINGGNIYIVIAHQRIVFKNTAESAELDGARIFDRFYQGSKKEGSTGLGLAIVDSICKLQNLHLRYFYESNKHCFEVSIA